MATKKTTLSELRSLIRNIIKEEYDHYNENQEIYDDEEYEIGNDDDDDDYNEEKEIEDELFLYRSMPDGEKVRYFIRNRDGLYVFTEWSKGYYYFVRIKYQDDGNPEYAKFASEHLRFNVTPFDNPDYGFYGDDSYDDDSDDNDVD